jgi:probable rRNA maturation factor
MRSLTISHTTRTYPKLPYKDIAADILPASYELSLVFLGPTRARQLNESSRGKTYIPNVLSFPLTNTAGEIFITPAVAAREAKQGGISLKERVAFLFIHGCLHLKGYDHGATMERLEKRHLTRAGF